MNVLLVTLFAIPSGGLALGLVLTVLRHRSRSGLQTFFDRLCRRAEG